MFASAAVAAALVLALLFAPAMAAAPMGSGTTAAASSGNTSEWAYGTHANFSLVVNGSHSNFTVHGWFAYHVILIQTNTSSSTYMLEANRTLGFAYDAQGTLCLMPKACPLSPTLHAQITVRATEHDVGFSNFTRNGTVTSNGSAVPALALVNDSTRMSSRYSETSNYSANLSGHTYTAKNQVLFAVHSLAAVQFAPALGLLPISVAPGMNWTSTSAYSAMVSTTGSFLSSRTTWNGATSTFNTSLNPSVNHTGNVTLYGFDVRNITLQNGQTTPVIVLLLGGPFVAREGMMFVPAASDPFGMGGAQYAGDSSGSVRAGTQVVDWAGIRGGHLGLLASASGISPAPAPPSAISSSTPGMSPAGSMATVPPMVRPNGSALPPAPAAQFQAQPETVPAAVQGDACIVSGNCGSLAPPSTSSPTHAVAGAILTVSAVVILAGLLAALIARRRSIPRPPASSTPAYPAPSEGPDVAPRAPPSPNAGRPGGPGAPPPPENDPLSHLW